MATIYNSQFLKADARKEAVLPGSRALLTQCDGRVAISDVFLAAGAGVALTLPGGNLNIILPVAGAVQVADAAGETYVYHEELYAQCADGGTEITITNPYEDETVNFLHISINKGHPAVEGPLRAVTELKIAAKNCLVAGGGQLDCLKIGVYDSRVKGHAALTQNSGAICSYIINGSFEVEDRLMEHRDGLCQWDVAAIDYEALSEAAIILFIECSQLK